MSNNEIEDHFSYQETQEQSTFQYNYNAHNQNHEVQFHASETVTSSNMMEDENGLDDVLFADLSQLLPGSRSTSAPAETLSQPQFAYNLAPSLSSQQQSQQSEDFSTVSFLISCVFSSFSHQLKTLLRCLVKFVALYDNYSWYVESAGTEQVLNLLKSIEEAQPGILSNNNAELSIFEVMISYYCYLVDWFVKNRILKAMEQFESEFENIVEKNPIPFRKQADYSQVKSRMDDFTRVYGKLT